MEKITSETLIRILNKNREILNSKFAFARYQNRYLEDHVFFGLLRRYLETIIEAHRHRDEARLESLTLTLYDQILSLYVHHYLGEEARHPHFENTLYELCLHFKDSFFEHPGMFSLLAHSAMNMSDFSVENLERWTLLIKKIPFSSPDTFKLQGFIAAWLTGCSAYRKKALEYLELIDMNEFNVFFNTVKNTSGRETIMRKLRDSPWFNPLREKSADTPNTVTSKVIGGFKGFDQIFVSPPRVFAVDHQIFATDSLNTFQIYADAFGVQWVSAPNFPEKEEDKPPPFPLTFRNGAVLFRNKIVPDLPELHFSTKSSASTAHTCFVTSHSSHKVFVFGLEDGDFND